MSRPLWAGEENLLKKKRLLVLINTVFCILVVGGLYLTGWLNSWEHLTENARFRLMPKQDLAKDIVIVTIDQNSLNHMKYKLKIYWKWPRDIYAYVIKYLQDAGARAIICDFDFSEPDITRAEYQPGETDALLAEAMKSAGNVYNIFYFLRELNIEEEKSTEADRYLAENFAVKLSHADRLNIPRYNGAQHPIPTIMHAVKALSVSNLYQDEDGVIRRFPLFHKYQGRIYPAVAFKVAADILGMDTFSITPERELKFLDRKIPLGADGAMMINWYGPGGPGEKGTYKYYPMAEVLVSYFKAQKGEPPLIPPEKFRYKIVLLGSNAPALYDLKPTPVATPERPYPGVEIHATMINNILHYQYFHWSEPFTRKVVLTGIVLGALFTSLLAFSINSVVVGIVGSFALAAFYIGFGFYLFPQNIILPIIPVEATIFFAFTSAAVFNYLTEGRQKRWMKDTFSKYVSSQVVEELAKNPELLKLGGDRKELTIMFSDIRGFSSISEKLEPHELVTFMNEYLTPMSRMVLKHQGTVDKFIGDAVMAFYGAPLPQPDHAVRGCLAALDMLAELEVLKARWKEEGRPDFIYNMRIGVGMSSGVVVVGNMGAEERLDFTVMGDEVNLASRLEGTNKEYGSSIILSENTYQFLEGRFLCRELDLVRVKGKQIPIRIYELLAEFEKAPETLVRGVETFHLALSLYRKQEFDRAAETFRKVITMLGQDPTSEVFIARCEKLKKAGLLADWDGVYTMTTK